MNVPECDLCGQHLPLGDAGEQDMRCWTLAAGLAWTEVGSLAIHACRQVGPSGSVELVNWAQC